MYKRQLAYFFYRKALQYRDEILSRVESGLASPDDVPEVVESNFRYKGPNPCLLYTSRCV